MKRIQEQSRNGRRHDAFTASCSSAAMLVERLLDGRERMMNNYTSPKDGRLDPLTTM
jgi:hypothetical protein